MGSIFINIQNPLNPYIEGGFEDQGYTHDAQVVTYTADHTNGFIADVKYEGKPHYGPAPHAPVHGPKYHPAPIHKPIPHHPAPYHG